MTNTKLIVLAIIAPTIMALTACTKDSDEIRPAGIVQTEVTQTDVISNTHGNGGRESDRF